MKNVINKLKKQREDWEWNALPDLGRRIRFLKRNMCCFCPYNRKLKSTEQSECICFAIKAEILRKKVESFNEEVLVFRKLLKVAEKEACIDVNTAFDFFDLEMKYIPPLDNEIDWLNKKINTASKEEYLNEVKPLLKQTQLLLIVRSRSVGIELQQPECVLH